MGASRPVQEGNKNVPELMGTSFAVNKGGSGAHCPAGLEDVLCSDYAVYGGRRPTPAPSSRNTLGRGGQEAREPKPLDTHLVTTAILTPKTPVCFREGILFKLNSLLVNLTESFTSICKRRRETALSPSWSAPHSSPLITTNLFSASFFLNH